MECTGFMHLYSYFFYTKYINFIRFWKQQQQKTEIVKFNIFSAAFSEALKSSSCEKVCLLLIKERKHNTNLIGNHAEVHGNSNHSERFLAFIDTKRTTFWTYGYAHEQNENLGIFTEQERFASTAI